jgi:hypothetical protein
MKRYFHRQHVWGPGGSHLGSYLIYTELTEEEYVMYLISKEYYILTVYDTNTYTKVQHYMNRKDTCEYSGEDVSIFNEDFEHELRYCEEGK